MGTLQVLFLVTLWTSVKAQASWWDRHKASISCERPGYFVNPTDCRSFYRCVDKSTWNKVTLQRYDFTCPSGMVFDSAVSVCTRPGPDGCASPWWPGKGSGNNGGSGERTNNFGRPAKGGAESGDPLDADFGGRGVENSERENTPSPGGNEDPSKAFEDFFGSNQRPESGQPSSQDKDPLLDFDFDSPTPNEASTTSSPSQNAPSGDNWWDSAPTSTSTPSPNESQNSIEFDPAWNPPSKPSNPTWNQPPRPSNPQNSPSSPSETPWTPTGPWGAAAGTSPVNDLGSSSSIPESPPFRPSPQRPSWWDPPFPNSQSIPRPPPIPANPRISAPPPPEPWHFAPYPARYPSYQLVSYPTWPGPYGRRRNPSIIVVYSNSRK